MQEAIKVMEDTGIIDKINDINFYLNKYGQQV
ncbi:MAG: hypothetical protein ACI9FY_001463, partial [Patiriisocius sp.]